MHAWDRRKFLKIIGVSAALSLFSQKAEGGLFLLKKLLGRPPRETKPLTPNDEFYVYHYAESAYLLIRDLNIRGWNLNITGNIRRPRSLTYPEIRDMPSSMITATIECIENPVGGTSIGNAAWRGILLKDLLADAGVFPGARDVILKAADGYTDSISIDRALSDSVHLAYEMNGVTLPRRHGYPLRAVVPGIYGMKNVKWITGIEVTDHDYKGYWQQRGWSDQASVRLTSRIDFPGNYQELSEGVITVRGIAFSGDQGIRSVHVSTNAGKSWNKASLHPPPFAVFLGYLEIRLEAHRVRRPSTGGKRR